MALEKILVAVGPNDGDRLSELTDVLCDIAVPTGADVVFFHAFSESAYEEGIEQAGFDAKDDPTPDDLAAQLEPINAIVKQVEEAETEAGLNYTVRGRIGSPADAILRYIEDEDVDLLVASGRKRSPTGKAVFGSTVHQILMNATCPVTFVREGIAGDAAVTDGDETDDDETDDDEKR